MVLVLTSMQAVRRLVVTAIEKFTWKDTDNTSVNLCSTIFYYMGLWPREDDPRTIGLVFRTCLSRVGLGFMVYTLILGHPYLGFLSWGKDLHLAVESVSSTFFSAMMTSVGYSMLFRRAQAKRMIRALKEMNYWSAQLPKRPEEILDRNKRWSDLMILLIIGGAATVFSTYLTLPSLYKNHELSYYAWYPFDETVSPYYEAVFVSTMITHAYSLIAIGVVMALFLALLVEAIAQFRLLSHNLKNNCRVQEQVPHRIHVKKSVESVATERLVPDTTQPGTILLCCRKWRLWSRDVAKVSIEKEVTDVLKICVQHHCSIIAFVEEVRLFYDLIVFLMLLCALVPTALDVVLIIFAKVPLFENQRTLKYIYLTLGGNASAYLSCWLAETLTSESEGVRDAVFGSDWFDQPEGFKQSMRIIISQCNQPVVIKIGGFIALSMETFYAMTKLTYSYCMAIWIYFLESSDGIKLGQHK